MPLKARAQIRPQAEVYLYCLELDLVLSSVSV
jgi:hypothetical protein